MLLCLQDAQANTALALRQVVARLNLQLQKPEKTDYAHNRVWWDFIQIEDLYPHKVLEVVAVLKELYPHPPAEFKVLGKQGPRVTTGTDETTIRVVRDNLDRHFL